MLDLVYTIGHSTHRTEHLLELLTRHSVQSVADVRSQPYSRRNPQFNRETLQADLEAAGFAYVFLGRELGARPEDRGCYVDGRVQYDLLARTVLFREGISRIAEGIGRQRMALMCAEKDPLTCHRAILVARQLAERGIEVQHILADGRIERHEDSLTRLLAELGIVEGDLFRSRDERILDAYSRRGGQIAFSEKGRSP